MDTAQHHEAAAATSNGRLILLLIAGIPVIIILASTWLWYFVANGELDLVGRLGTANNGELVQPPRQSLDAGWRGRDGEAYALAEAPRWTLLIPQPAANCGERCEHLLFETRQIHTLLAKNMRRVQRALVAPMAAGELQLEVVSLSDDRPLPDSFAEYLAREQRGLAVWESSPADFAELFPELEDQPSSWYLVDPAGWIMMRYDDSVPYQDVISDLKFLLKNTNG